MKYFPNGRYTYKGHSPGRYKISDGKICVHPVEPAAPAGSA